MPVLGHIYGIPATGPYTDFVPPAAPQGFFNQADYLANYINIAPGSPSPYGDSRTGAYLVSITDVGNFFPGLHSVEDALQQLAGAAGGYPVNDQTFSMYHDGNPSGVVRLDFSGAFIPAGTTVFSLNSNNGLSDAILTSRSVNALQNKTMSTTGNNTINILATQFSLRNGGNGLGEFRFDNLGGFDNVLYQFPAFAPGGGSGTSILLSENSSGNFTHKTMDFGAGTFNNIQNIPLGTPGVVAGVLPVANGGTGIPDDLTANQVLGKDPSGINFEGKTFTAGTGISVVNTPNTITINNTAVIPPMPVLNGITTGATSGAAPTLVIGANRIETAGGGSNLVKLPTGPVGSMVWVYNTLGGTIFLELPGGWTMAPFGATALQVGTIHNDCFLISGATEYQSFIRTVQP